VADRVFLNPPPDYGPEPIRDELEVEARNASRMLRHVPRLRLRHGPRQCRPHLRAMWRSTW